MRPELQPNARLFIFWGFVFFSFFKAEFSFSSPAAKDVRLLRRGRFGWACLARTHAKFLTFSDACSSLPAGQMLHLLSIIPLMLLSACFARRIAFKWQWSSYLWSLSATTVIDGRSEWNAYSIFIFLFFLHNLDYGIVPCTASQIEHKNASTTQLQRDKSMSWIFFYFF